jgi:hypothetical protein
MARYLVVAHQTSASPELVEALRNRDERDEAAFTLVVPATPPGLLVRPEEGRAKEIATHRDRSKAGLARCGPANNRGARGAPSPLDAIRDEQRDARTITTAW